MDTTINRRTSSFVSYVVIAQSTNNSVFIVEQFFFLLIKYNYLEWTRKSCFNLLRFYCNEKKYLRAKLRVKTKRSSSKVNFSQDNIFFSKIVYVFKISSIAFSNLSTYSRLRFPRIFLEKKKKKYAIEWDTVSSISPGLRAIESTHADLRLGRGVAWSRACPRYRSRDDKGRGNDGEKTFKVVWENLKLFFFLFFQDSGINFWTLLFTLNVFFSFFKLV